MSFLKLNLTKRDLKFFFLGLLSYFVFETFYDWDNNVAAFKHGMEDARKGQVKF